MDAHNKELDEDNTFAKEALLCDIGLKLQKARERKGLSQEQVVADLKLNSSFLEALESGEWSQMPGEVYAIGFLRQYADLLGIDVNADIQRIKSNAYELTIPLTYPDAAISPNRTWVFTAVLLFILIIIITNLLDADNEKKEGATSPQQQHTSDISVEPYSSPSMTTESEQIIQSEPVQVSIMSPTVTNNSTTEQKANTNKMMMSTHRYIFSAVSADVWLQLYKKDLNQEPQLEREALLTMGESFTLESDALLLLTSGKPTALKIERDGEIFFQTGELGEEGRVLKLFPLE